MRWQLPATASLYVVVCCLIVHEADRLQFNFGSVAQRTIETFDDDMTSLFGKPPFYCDTWCMAGDYTVRVE